MALSNNHLHSPWYYGVAIWARLNGEVLLLALLGLICICEVSWPVKLWLDDPDNLMLISGTLAGKARMTDIAQPPSTWSFILQQFSQDLFPGWQLQNCQEPRSIMKGKYQNTITSQFSAGVLFVSIWLAKASHMANSSCKNKEIDYFFFF